MKDYNSHGIYNNGKPTVASAIFSPLNALYDVFGSGPKQARRFQRYAANDLEQTEIARRFNKGLIKQVTGMADEKIQKFIDAYKPSYPDIKKWNDYDLIAYIKRSYADFEEKKEQVTIQKLY